MASTQPAQPSSYQRLYGKLPDRSNPAPTFAASSTRDRLHQQQQQQQQNAPAYPPAPAAPSPLASLTDEQREEITEAVRSSFPLSHQFPLPLPTYRSKSKTNPLS